MTKKFVDELVSFMQQKGFVWGPSPEIYGGAAGFYTYAPLGKMLKNNVENTIRKVFMDFQFFEVECPTIMSREVWEASGHLGGFTDSMVSCIKCKVSFKVEQVVEEQFPNEKVTDFKKFFSKNEVKCLSCGARLPAEIKEHNLMMKTSVGTGTEAYSRPETATTTYLEFLRYHDFFRKKLPFGVFQIGNAYRNEISPRQHLLRTREFTQAEAQLFIFKHQKNHLDKFRKIENEILPLWSWNLINKKKAVPKISLKDALKNKILKNQAYAFTLWLTYRIFRELGIPESKMRFAQHSPEEKAFYADDAWDLEIELNSFGWTEICGVHDRTNYDLTQHSKHSKTNMEVFNEESGKKEIPHILEIAFGTGRATFAVLDLNYDKKKADEGKSLLKLPVNLAPFKIALFPLMKKPELLDLSKQIFDDLSKDWLIRMDMTGSIGKRYLRSAEEGTPYAITVDFDSLEDKSVTLRNRDTEEQIRVKVSDIHAIMDALIKKRQSFDEVKKNFK